MSDKKNNPSLARTRQQPTPQTTPQIIPTTTSTISDEIYFETNEEVEEIIEIVVEVDKNDLIDELNNYHKGCKGLSDIIIVKEEKPEKISLPKLNRARPRTPNITNDSNITTKSSNQKKEPLIQKKQAFRQELDDDFKLRLGKETKAKVGAQQLATATNLSKVIKGAGDLAPELTKEKLCKLTSNLERRKKDNKSILGDKARDKAKATVKELDACFSILQSTDIEVDDKLKLIEQCQQSLLSFKEYSEKNEKSELKNEKSFVSAMCGSFDLATTQLNQVTEGLKKTKQETTDLLKDSLVKINNFKLGKSEEITPQTVEALRKLQNTKGMPDRDKIGEVAKIMKKELDQKATNLLQAITNPTEEDKAEIFLEYCGGSRPDKGSSDVILIKAPDDTIAFAFKSVTGESDQMGTPKGFGTGREVLMSKMCDGIKEQTKGALDFRWPKTCVAKVNDKPGALIEGVKGTKMEDMNMADVPPKEVAKVLLCNLAMGQFDLKQEDVRFEKTDKGLEATPMDGGAAMPDSDTLMNFVVGLGVERPGAELIKDQTLANSEMDEETIKQFLSIDLDKIKETAAKETAELKKANLDPQQLGLDVNDPNSGIATAIKSIEGIKKILADNEGKPVKITLDKFLERFEKEVIHGTLVPDEKKKEYEKNQRESFKLLAEKHPKVLNAENVNFDVMELYKDFLCPVQMNHLKQLEAKAKPGQVSELLDSCGIKMPIGAFKSTFEKVVERERDFARAEADIKAQEEKIELSRDNQEKAPLLELVKKAKEAVEKKSIKDYQPAMFKLKQGTSAIVDRLKKEYDAAIKEL